MIPATKPSGYYLDPRSGLADLIDGERLRLLDIGCAGGEAGRFLLSTGKAAWVSGVEIEPEQAAIARSKLNEVICGDVGNLTLPWPQHHFDCIMCLDVLEHLIDPWDLLRRLKPLLKSDGYIVASIPNVKFFPVVYNLLIHNDWQYKDCGVLDSTHLRFFTKKTAVEMFTASGYRVEQVASYLSGVRYRIPSRLSFGLLDTFMAVQWQIRARH